MVVEMENRQQDIIGVAADFDNRKFYWHVNGEYIDSGSGTSNPSTGANANSTYTASEVQTMPKSILG